MCSWRNGDAAVVDAQQEAETQTQRKRQQQVVLTVGYLENRTASANGSELQHAREQRDAIYTSQKHANRILQLTSQVHNKRRDFPHAS